MTSVFDKFTLNDKKLNIADDDYSKLSDEQLKERFNTIGMLGLIIETDILSNVEYKNEDGRMQCKTVLTDIYDMLNRMRVEACRREMGLSSLYYDNRGVKCLVNYLI